MDAQTILTSSIVSTFITGSVLYFFQKWVDKRLSHELQRAIANLDLDKRKASLVVDQWEEGVRCATKIHGKIATIRKSVREICQNITEATNENARLLQENASEIEMIFQNNRTSLLIFDDITFRLIHQLKNMLNFTAHSVSASIKEKTIDNSYLPELESIDAGLKELDERLSIVLKENIQI